MKNKILVIALFILSLFLLVGCGDVSEKTLEPSQTITSVRVKFYVDDEVYLSKKYEIGSKVELPEEPTKEGYKFVGWFTKDGEEISFEKFIVENKIDLYARFEEDTKTPVGKYYKVNFYVNDDLYYTETYVKNEKVADVITPDNPTGYFFIGWYTEDKVAFKSNYIITSDLNVYAKFGPIGEPPLEKYTVTYYVDGNIYLEEKYEEGETLGYIDNPYKENHEFKGWIDFYGVQYLVGDEIYSDLKLYAVFEYVGKPIETYKITYYIDGVYYLSQYCKEGSYLEIIDAPIKEGYEFIGWFDMYGNQYNGGYIYSNINLYAKFEEIIAPEVIDFTYNEYESYIEITGYTGNEDFLEIPSEINGKTVTHIADYAFENCTFKEVHLPNTISRVNIGAFKNCYNLEEITTNYYDSNFGYAQFHQLFTNNTNEVNKFNLKRVTIINTPTIIGHPFEACCIEEIIIKDGVGMVMQDVFAGIVDLRTIIIDNPGYVAPAAFTNIENVDIFFVNNELANHEFITSSSNTIYLYSETKSSVPGNYWYYDEQGNPVIWKNEKNNNGFSYDEYEDYIEITGYDGNDAETIIPEYINGKPVTRIDQNFIDNFNCQYVMTTLVFPDTLEYIEKGAFYKKGPLGVIRISSIDEWVDIVFEDVTSNPLVDNPLEIEDSQQYNLKITKNITKINDYAFYNLSYIQTIVIPSSVETIGDYAFYNCNNLSRIYTEHTSEEWNNLNLGKNEFTNVSIYTRGSDISWGIDENGNIVETYKVEFFVDDILYHTDYSSIGIKMEAPTAPTKEGYKFVGWYYQEFDFMWDFENHASIYPTTLIAIFEEVIPLTYNEYDSYIEITGYTGNDTDTVIIPGYINGKNVYIGDTSMMSLPLSVKEVIISEGVLSIGESAFDKCSIEKISLPNSLLRIENYAFYMCYNLTISYLPSNISYIGTEAFRGCHLDGIVIKNMGYSFNSFSECSGYVYFEGNHDAWYNAMLGLSYEQAYFYYETREIYFQNTWRYVDGIPTVWEDIYYTITLIVDNEIYEEKQVLHGDYINCPMELEKSGHTFLGWYDINDVFYYGGDYALKDLVLYAKFAEE